MSESGGRYAHITGWGAHVPARAVTNQDLSQILPTSDAWIQERTGIVERHIAEEGEYTSTMAIHAGRQALKIANLDPSVLDLVICATSTPDYLMPNTASLIQDGLGAGNAAAFDLNTACLLNTSDGPGWGWPPWPWPSPPASPPCA